MGNIASPNAAAKKRAIGIVWLTVFIDLVGFSIIFPLFPAMLEWYLPREEAGSILHQFINALESFTQGENQEFLIIVLFGGILGSLYSVLQFFSSPFWGRISDKHGRRSILLITTAGTAVSYLLWIVSGSFWVLILSRTIGGIMAGNIAVATASIADLTDTRNRSKGMALIGVAFGLGFILGPALGGLGSLVDLGSDPTTMAAIALTPFSFPALLAFVLAVANVLLVWKVFPETYKKSDTAKETPARRPLIAFGSPIPHVNRALKVYFLFIFSFAGMEFTLTFIALERLAYEPHDMIWLFLFIGFIMALTQGYAVRKYGHRFGERNFVTAGLLMGFLSLVVLSMSHSTGYFYLGLALLGIGVGCVSPSLSALVSIYSPADRQGTELGVFRSLGALGRAIGPILGAGVFWYAGSQISYIAGSAFFLLASLFSLILPKPDHTGENKVTS